MHPLTAMTRWLPMSAAGTLDGLRDRLRGRLDVLGRLLIDTARMMESTARGLTHAGADVLRRANLGIGPVRLTPETFDRFRRLAIDQVKEILEIPDADQINGQHRPLAADQSLVEALLATTVGDQDEEDATLRERFQHLLERSLDIHESEHPHPAFGAILAQLSPDEARIVRLLAGDPEHPVVDIVAAPTLGLHGRVVKENLNMLGDRAGCSVPENAPAYVANLARLGLVTVSDDELPDHPDYELIEVSPQYHRVAEDLRHQKGTRVRSHRKTLRLSPLGEQFCEVCIPPGDTA